MNDSFDYNSSAEWHKERQRKTDAKNAALFRKATSDCKQIVDMIIEKYNPVRIYQWGSLLDEKSFDENSDIDIAVEGLGSAEVYFALLGDAIALTTFSLDLIEMEKIDPIDRGTIHTKGKIVYERKE
jgi:predicted nucleotidyltransferase